MAAKPKSLDHVEDVNPVESRRSITQTERVTSTVLLFALFILATATIVSYDLGYGGTVLLMEPFNRAFGPCHELPTKTGASVEICRVTALQQSLISLTTLFIAAGSLCNTFAAHYFGRRGTLQLGSAIILIGAAGMLGTAGSFVNYMVCKCINGLGQGLLYACVIIYGVESTPPQRRGLLLGAFTIGLALGTGVAAGICAASSNITNNWAWKTPIVSQIPLALITISTSMLFPESPRWYLQKNQENKARKSFGRFYHMDAQSDGVTALVQEVQAYLEFERHTATTTSWTEIFHKTQRRRTLVAMWIMCAINLTGVQFVGPYTAIFLGGLGIGSPFLNTAIISLCFFAGSLLGGSVIDYGGRRFGLLFGYSVLAACMLVISTVSSGLNISDPVAQRVLVAFLCMWTFTFSSCIAPSTWVAGAELHSIRLRTHGQAVGSCIANIASFGAQFWTPYMLSPEYGNMGTNVGYFYFGLTFITIIVTFFIVPETARLKLEQIDDYFGSGIPAWKTSIGRNKRLAAQNVMEVTADVVSKEPKIETE